MTSKRRDGRIASALDRLDTSVDKLAVTSKALRLALRRSRAEVRILRRWLADAGVTEKGPTADEITQEMRRR